MITPIEILRLVIMTLALGFIFKDILKVPSSYDPLKKKAINYHDFLFASIVVAPAIILHEMAHKFVAVFFGLSAEFHAHYLGLGLGIFLRLIGSPFLFFVPGFVMVEGASPLQHSIIAVAGPLMNLALWIAAALLLRSSLKIEGKSRMALHLTKQINMLLFIFNMLPIPGFDGYHFFTGMYQAFF